MGNQIPAGRGPFSEREWAILQAQADLIREHIATGPQRSDSGAPNSCPDCKKGIIHYPNGEQYVCHHCHGTGRLILDPMKGSFTSPCPRCSVPLDDALVTVELTREEAEHAMARGEHPSNAPMIPDFSCPDCKRIAAKFRASLERTSK